MKYQQKARTVESIQWTGSNLKKIKEFLRNTVTDVLVKYCYLNVIRKDGDSFIQKKGWISKRRRNDKWDIITCFDDVSFKNNFKPIKEKKMAEKKEKFIQKAIKHPGALRKTVKVKKGEKIPEAKLKKAEHSKNTTTRKRAVLAETLKRIHHK
jgi:hypothetical protein